MFAIRFLKAPPTTWVLHYKDGRVKREGAGLSFFYWAPTSTIVSIRVGTTDLPFVFNLVTADFQNLTLQGQITFRVADPRRLAALLDFSVKANGAYVSEDPEKLQGRLTGAAQVACQTLAGRMTIRQALVSAENFSVEVLAGLAASPGVAALGLEVLGFAVLALRPTPEMAKALEAEAREALHRKADEAIYARRNAAVEEERKIKESELNTEVAVAEKERKIRETKMAGEIAVEDQRKALIASRAENERKDADSRAYALRATLEPLRGMDWRTLMAASAAGADPKLMIALAFRELAENAGKIGELNVTPDLLRSLLAPSPGGARS